MVAGDATGSAVPKQPALARSRRRMKELSSYASTEASMDLEDFEPRNKPKKPRDLTPFAIAELQEYIERLQAEIERARAAIASKQGHRSSADAFFKKPT
jgi:uncharacterized small protein (DUF1192 family)